MKRNKHSQIPRRFAMRKNQARLSMGIRSLIVAFLLVSLTGCVSGTSENYLDPDSPVLSLRAVFDDDAIAKALAPSCLELQRMVPSKADLKLYKNRIAKMKKVGSNPRKARSFQLKNNWVEFVQVDDSLDHDIATSVKSALEKLVATEKRISFNDRDAFVSLFAEDLRGIAMTQCELSSSVPAAQKVVHKYVALSAAINDAALSAPWYPSGYNLWAEDSTLAWKWFSKSCYLGDSCWHIKVISETGCPDGIYAELLELDSADNVIDYTNDSIPVLGAGNTAILEFSTYNSSTSSGRLATLDCHSY